MLNLTSISYPTLMAAINTEIFTLVNNSATTIDVEIHFKTLKIITAKAWKNSQTKHTCLWGFPGVLNSKGWKFKTDSGPTLLKTSKMLTYPYTEYKIYEVILTITKKAQSAILGTHTIANITVISRVSIEVRSNGDLEDPKTRSHMVAKCSFIRMTWIGNVKKFDRLLSIDPETYNLYYINGKLKGQKSEVDNIEEIKEKIKEIVTR